MNKFSLYIPALLLSILIIQACSSTNSLRISVKTPPQVLVPAHIRTVGLVNRSLPPRENKKKVGTVVEGIISGEGINEDKNGSPACLRGAESQFNKDNYLPAKVLDTLSLYGTGTGVMAPQLAWDQVGEICQKAGVDALIVLETFDTDQSGSVTTNAIRQIADIAITGDVRPVAPVKNTQVLVKMGWRFYDYQNRVIVDEARISDCFGVNNSNGIVYDLGEFAKRDALQQSAFVSGCAYAARIFPSLEWVGRTYFVRKGQEMKMAARMVEVNDWDNAIQIWTKLAESPKRKIAGRACYNLALGYEVKGDLPVAVKWAERSYTLYRQKLAPDYVRILNQRISRGW